MRPVKPHHTIGMNIDGREFIVQAESNGTRDCWQRLEGRKEPVDAEQDRIEVVETVQTSFPGVETRVRFPQADGTVLMAIPRMLVAELEGVFKVEVAGVVREVDTTPEERLRWEAQATRWGQAEFARQARRRISRPTSVGSVLGLFAKCCSGETREIVRAIVHDLRKDVREMRKEGRSQWVVLGVRFWVTLATIARMFSGGAVRAAKRVLVLGILVRAICELFRRFDPPKFG